MHIHARDETPSKPFCFIIEYTPYINDYVARVQFEIQQYFASLY